MADTDARGLSDPSPDSLDTNPDGPRGRTPWNTVGGRVICLVSRKGGVGKTTSAVNLGAALALSGHSVLLVGTDPQCGICRSLGTAPEDLPVSLTDLFDCGEQLQDLVQISPLEGLHYISPRVLTLEDEERYLDSLERRAGEFVREIDRARNLYDTIIIDCPPSLGPGARAALLASDGFLVPVQTEELCRRTVQSLLDFVDEFRARNFAEGDAARVEMTPTLDGIFLTMAAERTRAGRHVAARLDEEFGDVLYTARVPRTTRLAEMALKGKPAVIYDRRSPGSRAYFDLADELVARYCQSHAEADEEPAAVSRGSVPDESSPAAVAVGEHGLKGFDRFLYELSGGDPCTLPGVMGDPPAELDMISSEPDMVSSEPDMVSLDELLAEEEIQTRNRIDDLDDGYWAPDSESFDRMN
ncbi:hypothetical protein DRQ50_01300 [bacterium]|nr:MAG: hypothetical protein DRQ50_01300 [bacterium]